MKNLKFLLACMLLTACVQTIETDFPSVNSKGEYAIQFGSKTTRASINTVSGTDYDQFNLYVWNSNNDTIMKPYRVEASGVGEYAYATLPNQELKYFSNTASSYYFTGVIPTTHKETILGDTIKVDTIKAFTIDDARVTNTLIAESPEEFLYAYKKVDKVDYGNIVTLPFKHENALIYIGFSSDRDDTQLLDYVPGTPATPATLDTTDTYINLKNATNIVATTTQIKAPGSSSYVAGDTLPTALVAEIKSYYSIDNGAPGDYNLGLGKSVWDPVNQNTNLLKALRVVKDIPNEYKKVVDIHGEGINMTFFDAIKYLNDNGYQITSGTTGGKPQVFTNGYIILDAYKNGTNYSISALNWASANSVPVYSIDTVPGVAGRQAIEGVRVFSADSIGENNLPADTAYCVHIPHTMIADAYVDSTGCKLDNRVTSDSVIQFSLPTTTTLSTTPVWSATTFYGLPGDANFNFIVVKLSYIYNGITSYDVRVPIKLPAGGLQAGKYYKYEIKIQSTGNGTNDPNEATNEKDEILIEGLHPIVVNLQVDDYTQGANQQIKI
jgi:hypothetical protein